MKLLYTDASADDSGKASPPEAQVKLQDCFQLKEHPMICEGKLPLKLWLCAPDGKRVGGTLNWPAFKAKEYQQIKSSLVKKYPGVAWV